MNGKRILITGGNSGIGLVASVELAKMGAEVVLACRDSDKTADALRQINAVTEIPATNLPVDLASLQSVRDLANAFTARYDKLDVLINNAGTFPTKLGTTEDGFEMQFGVNHLAHFLLTDLLKGVLQANAPSRVVTVSSTLHRKASIDFDSFRAADFSGGRKYNAQKAYGQSKLANVLFAMELAKRLEGTGVTSNVLHPGGVDTDIVRHLPWLLRKAIGLMFISPEEGAKTTIMLASDEALTGVSGRYYDQCKEAAPSPLANDAALREKLWQVSEEAASISA